MSAILTAGFGFRSGVGVESLRAALALAEGEGPRARLFATAARKADHPALLALAAERGVKIWAVAAQDLAGVETLTRSARAQALFETGSLAEAAALAAAGAGARLLGPRAASPDGAATAALAIREHA